MRQSLLASGSFDFIDEGEVTPIGNTGYYWVNDRHVWGTLGVDEPQGLESDIEGSFFMTYDAIVAIENQKGPFWGELQLYDKVEDITYTATFHAQSEGELTSFDPDLGGTMQLEIDGRLIFTNNANGRADFDGSIEVALDPAGHISGILSSDFTIEGWWEPDIDDRSNPPIADRWDADGEDTLVHHMDDLMPESLLA